MHRRRGVQAILCLLLCAITTGWGSAGPAVAQTPGGPDQVRAVVYCENRTVSISVDNGFWNPIEIAYVGAFSMTSAGDATFMPITLDPAESMQLDRHSWLELTATEPATWEHERDRTHGILLVTSAGVLMPTCDGGYFGLLDDPGTTPRDIDDATRIQITAATVAIGRLESLRADDALYAMLHPDVQAAVSPAEFSCWLDGQFGKAGSGKGGVISTTVNEITSVNGWDWKTGGTTYDSATEVAYTQEITGAASPVDGTLHLVWVETGYRWFPDDGSHALGAGCG